MTNVTIKDENATADATTTDKKTLTNMLHSEEISLDDKLKAIEEAMKTAQAQAGTKTANGTIVPEDPSLSMMCDSCQ